MTGREGGGPARYDSPQAVYDAAKAASATKDYSTFCNCLTPESQGVQVAALIHSALFMKDFAANPLGAPEGEQAKQDVAASSRAIDDVLAKHGMKEDQLKRIQAIIMNPASGASPKERKESMAAIVKLTTPIKDKPAFMAEMKNAIAAHYQAYLGKEYTEEGIWKGRLESIEREGYHATAQVVGTMLGKVARVTIGFRKVNGSWLIELRDAAPIARR